MQLLVNALIAGSLAALIAGGLALVYGVLGVFNLALGQLALTGGFITWWLHVLVGLPLPLAVLAGLVLSGLIVLLTFEVTIAPFYRRDKFSVLITTIAWSLILDSLILMIFGEKTRNILTRSKTFIEFGSMRFSQESLILVAITLMVICSIAFILHSTSFGRKIRSTVQHPDAARSLGISSSLLHRIVFLGSGLLAAMGGIYIGIDQSLTPMLAFPLTIKAYAAVVAGGKDNFWGTIVCAYLIALIEQLAVGVPWWFGNYVSQGYQSAVSLIVIIVVLLIKPTGLFSRQTRTA